MTDQEINIAIAEACGWRLFVIRKPLYAPFDLYRPNAQGYTGNIAEAWKVAEDVAKKYVTGPAYNNEPDKVVMEPAPVPDYCHDLNAMHEAWNYARTHDKSPDHEFESGFDLALTEVVLKTGINPTFVKSYTINATARQRAEAFLRTIGKWRGE